MVKSFHRDELARLEDEVAALLRQYRRATEAKDEAAARVEGAALCDRVHWLLYHHLEMQLASPLDEWWFWLDGTADEWRVELESPLSARVAGRVWCGLSVTGGRQWTEPFLAYFSHLPLLPALGSYTVCLGRRSTLCDEGALREYLAAGCVFEVVGSSDESHWAFVFHKK
jgi:hypothetical protein